MIEDTIYDRLTTVAGYLVGGTHGGFSRGFSSGFAAVGEGRIWPVAPPVDAPALPFVLYSVPDTQPVWTLAGPTGSAEYTVQVDVYSFNFKNAQAIAGVIRTGMDGWKSSVVGCCKMTGSGSQALESGYQYQLTFYVLGSV